MAKKRANNEGTIFKTSEGTWRAQATVRGKRISRTKKTRREAQLWLRKTLREIDDGYSFDAANISLSNFLENWLVTIQASRSAGTVAIYEFQVRKAIIPQLGETLLKDLRPAQIQAVYDRFLREGKSNHFVHHTHKILKVALGHATKLGMIISNPTDRVTAPKPEHREMRIYDEGQVQAFLSAARELSESNYALYYLAFHSGLRRAELLGLKWEDIDWGNRTLSVQRQLFRPKGGGFEFTKPKSRNGSRTIKLGQSILEVLRDHQTNQWIAAKDVGEKWVDHDLIFPSGIGTPLADSKLRRSFRRVIKKSGLPQIRFHDLRHTAASLMLNWGIAPIIVSRRLGHASISITMDVYGHLIPAKEEEAAALMDELLNPEQLPVAPRLHRSTHSKADPSA